VSETVQREEYDLPSTLPKKKRIKNQSRNAAKPARRGGRPLQKAKDRPKEKSQKYLSYSTGVYYRAHSSPLLEEGIKGVIQKGRSVCRGNDVGREETEGSHEHKR